MKVNHLSVDNSPTGYRVTVQRPLGSNRAARNRPVASGLAIASAIGLHENGGVGRSTNSSSVLCDCIQYRLNIRRRTGNNSQNLTRGSLLLQRLLELVK